MKDKRQSTNRKQHTNRPRRYDSVPEPEVVWKPVTELGKKVNAGEITDIGDIFNQGQNILEAEIVSVLIQNLEELIHSFAS